jgi:hypothetical protein
MPDRTATGVVTHFYVSPDGAFNVWPVPATDPGVFLQYQRVVDDSSVSVTPDVLQTWKGSLSFGVADHIGLQCSAPQATRVEVAQRWTFKRNLMLQNAVPAEAISFEVRE